MLPLILQKTRSTGTAGRKRLSQTKTINPTMSTVSSKTTDVSGGSGSGGSGTSSGCASVSGFTAKEQFALKRIWNVQPKDYFDVLTGLGISEERQLVLADHVYKEREATGCGPPVNTLVVVEKSVCPDELSTLSHSQKMIMMERMKQIEVGPAGQATVGQRKSEAERRIKEFAFPMYKVIGDLDKIFNSDFCKDVYKAVGRTPDPGDWKYYLERALKALRNKKSTVNTDLGLTFKGKWKVRCYVRKQPRHNSSLLVTPIPQKCCLTGWWIEQVKVQTRTEHQLVVLERKTLYGTTWTKCWD